MSTLNPTSMATSLATSYMQGANDELTTESSAASASATALTTLQSALSTFDTALTTLSSGTGVAAYSAGLSDPSVGTATASTGATPGTYSFFVQQIATAQQAAYTGLSSVPAAGAGTLTVDLDGGGSFSVNLSAADSNGDGTLSATEMAAAINGASGNSGAVVASVVTVGTQTELVLSAGATGAANGFSLDTSQVTDGTLASSLASGTPLSAAQDAVVYLGGAGGVKMQQASNTYDVSGASVTFTQAQNTGASPVTLTVASDASTTVANVQSFVAAYNTVQSALSALTSDGNPSSGVAAGTLANDSGVLSLETKLNELIRQSFGGSSLIGLGVSADQYGTLSVNSTTLTAALTANPSAVSNVFGGVTDLGNTGMLGSMDTYLQTWLRPATGTIAERQTSVQATQKSLAAKQTDLTNQYNALYNRYLSQFTTLQALQEQLSNTENMFFSSSTSSSSSSSSSGG
jgi:flagellar hook-associated protein 2